MNADICIIGSGPAGLIAAITAAQKGGCVVICESNTTAGRKLLLTGGGRCNLTNNRDTREFIKAYGEKMSFARHCIYDFSPQKLIDFFHSLNVPTKTENDGCVFPLTEKSSNIRDALLAQLKKSAVNIIYDNQVTDIVKENRLFYVAARRKSLTASKIIIAAGGLSYPQTGSTGDGYRFAERFGHKIATPKPALVPLVTQQTWPKTIAGTAVSGVKITAKIDGSKITSCGDLIFTHNGIGGPAALDFSRLITDYLFERKEHLNVSIDLIDSLPEPALENKLLELCEKNPKKSLISVLSALLPKRLIGILCGIFDFNSDITANQLAKTGRKKLVKLLKSLPLTITSAGPIADAIITRGGVCTGQIDPHTMQSKICPGLFFAGEVIDVDGPSGGYNLQFAFSTGRLAGL